MGNNSELQVITKAKDLASYVLTITQKSPKHFRYTFVNRMQNLSLDIITDLFKANDIYITKGKTNAMRIRQSYQQNALSNLRILSYISLLAMEQKCILMKQYEIISKFSADCQNMVGAWIISDNKRMNN